VENGIMNYKRLMSSTALVGAGVVLAGSALAQEGGGFTVRLSGFTEFGGIYASDETMSTGSDRGYNFYNDNEVHIRSKVELEAGSGFDAQSSNASVDEVGLYFSSGWGRLELGSDDGAEDVMFVGGEDAQAGTGGIDGDTANLAQLQLNDTGDAMKATYFTPRLAGFQLGASYTPDNAGDSRINNNGTIQNSFGGGVNWVGVLGPVDMTLSAVGLVGDGEPQGPNSATSSDDPKAWAVGGLLGFGGFTLGLAYNSEKDSPAGLGDVKIFNAGLKYGFGPANVSVGYVWNKTDDFDDDQHEIAVSGDYGLMPGVTLKADYTYNNNDPGKDVSSTSVCQFGECQGSTSSAVVTVQLDY
jgi:outer membrane protein OmpU